MMLKGSYRICFLYVLCIFSHLHLALHFSVKAINLMKLNATMKWVIIIVIRNCSAGLLSDRNPNHKRGPCSGSRAALASISVCVWGAFSWQLPSRGPACYDRGTKKKGNVCVHACIGGDGRGPGEGGGRQEGKDPGQAWGMQIHEHVRQVKVDLRWGEQMVCFKVCWIKASGVRVGKERPPTYQPHLSPTNAYIFLNPCKHVRDFSHRDINDARSIQTERRYKYSEQRSGKMDEWIYSSWWHRAARSGSSAVLQTAVQGVILS